MSTEPSCLVFEFGVAQRERLDLVGVAGYFARNVRTIEVLSITGGEPFKVRVYEKAARAVAGYPQDVAGLDEAGLRHIPKRGQVETVGDIDILTAAEDSEPLMDAFAALPIVAEVIARGPTKTSIRTTEGLQVDLRVVAPAAWGAALQYFTGSKAHNIRTRELAIRNQLKLSEYSLFQAESGELIVYRAEEDVYARLGLPWIPPPLREDRGEIDAALSRSPPRPDTRAASMLISLMSLIGTREADVMQL